MGPAAETGIILRRELLRSARSAKGLVLAALAILGGAGVSALLAKIEDFRRATLPPGVELKDLQEQLFVRLYGESGGRALAGCPYGLWIMLMATLWLSPLLVSLMSFDAISGDLQHRTVRYWALRCRRGSYVTGKFLGSWMTVLAVLLCMNVVVWATTAQSDRLPFTDVASWGIRLFAIAVPITAAWCGIATLVGSLCKAPFMALSLTGAVFTALWLARFAFPQTSPFAHLDPNGYDGWFLSADAARVIQGLVCTALLAASGLGTAILAFQRRDL